MSSNIKTDFNLYCYAAYFLRAQEVEINEDNMAAVLESAGVSPIKRLLSMYCETLTSDIIDQLVSSAEPAQGDAAGEEEEYEEGAEEEEQEEDVSYF